jgi:hypothetical protein
VYFDVFKVIFVNTYIWAQPHDLRLALPPFYALGIYVELIMKKNTYFEPTCVLNRHAVQRGNNKHNAAFCFDTHVFPA